MCGDSFFDPFSKSVDFGENDYDVPKIYVYNLLL